MRFQTKFCGLKLRSGKGKVKKGLFLILKFKKKCLSGAVLAQEFNGFIYVFVYCPERQQNMFQIIIINLEVGKFQQKKTPVRRRMSSGSKFAICFSLRLELKKITFDVVPSSLDTML